MREKEKEKYQKKNKERAKRERESHADRDRNTGKVRVRARCLFQTKPIPTPRARAGRQRLSNAKLVHSVTLPCPRCSRQLPLSVFPRAVLELHIASDGTRHGPCRDCRRAKKYALPVGAFDKLLSAQGGACGICGKIPSRGSTTAQRYALDHDHMTGYIRGILCNPCNHALGRLEKKGIATRETRFTKYLTNPPARSAMPWTQRNIRTQSVRLP